MCVERPLCNAKYVTPSNPYIMSCNVLAHLQAGTVDGLDINNELAATVVQDEDTDAATSRLEGLGQTAPETRLVSDGDAGLDVASLGHGDNITILDVQDAVLLENGSEHGLDDDAGGRVGDGRRLLMKLLCEQINT